VSTIVADGYVIVVDVPPPTAAAGGVTRSVAPRYVIATQRAAFVNVGIVHTPSYSRNETLNAGDVPRVMMLVQFVGSVGIVADVEYENTHT
jgi:hypothetical protein